MTFLDRLTGLAAKLAAPAQPRDAKEALREPQTTPLVKLRESFAGHPVRGLTPEKMASLLTAAESGDLAAQADLFNDMEERDPHLHAEMAKRRRAMLGLPWSIEPPPNPSAREKRQAKGVEELLAALPDLEDTMLDALDAIGHGFACLELRWAKIDGAWLPEEISHRPQSWFLLDKATRSELHLNDGSSAGTPLWPMGWIVHRHAARSGYLTRAGLYRVLAWPWIMRQFSLRDMAEWLEIYGLPLRIGKYPVGAQPDDKAVLARAVRDLGRNAAGIMPEDMAVELVAAATGAADPFMAMVAYCDAAMSKAILGGTLSSTPGATGMGSGVATLQGEVRRDLLVSDARQLQGTLSRDLIWPIAALNGLGDDPRRAPRLTFDTREATDLTAFSQSLERLVSAGLGPNIPVAWVREQTGIPEPAEGEPVLALPAANAPPDPTAEPPPAGLGARGGARLASTLGTGARGRFTPDQAAVEDLIDAALADAASPIPAARLRAAVAEATDPDDLVNRLARLYNDTSPAAWTELVERALFAADVLGYATAAQQATPPTPPVFNLEANIHLPDGFGAPAPVHILNQVPEAPAPVVQVAAPEVHVAAPNVQVAAPEVRVEAPIIQVAAPDVHVAAPTVNVAAPNVLVTNQVPPAQVTLALPPRKTETTVKRDSLGHIVHATQIETDANEATP